jgi:hypothetical protein
VEKGCDEAPTVIRKLISDTIPSDESIDYNNSFYLHKIYLFINRE